MVFPMDLKAFAETAPGVLLTFRRSADGAFSIPYASEKLFDLVGIRPADVVEQAETLLTRMQPENLEPFWSAAEESRRTSQA